VLGLAADPVRGTYWVFTDQSLFELVVGNEDRDIWKVYLEKGQFEVALRYSKVRLRAQYIALGLNRFTRLPVNETKCSLRRQTTFLAMHNISKLLKPMRTVQPRLRKLLSNFWMLPNEIHCVRT
jgi:hypothetical protein